MFDGPGISEQIKHAKSEEAIAEFLDIGASFSNATDATKRRWEKLARNRQLQLKRKKREELAHV